MFLPPRDASVIDLAANARGALLGGMAGASLTRARPRARRAVARRAIACSCPASSATSASRCSSCGSSRRSIPASRSSRSRSTPSRAQAAAAPVAAAAPDTAAHADRGRANRRSSCVGVGLFLALLLRERRFVGGAVLLLVGAALLAKGVAAMLLLKPAVWETWLQARRVDRHGRRAARAAVRRCSCRARCRSRRARSRCSRRCCCRVLAVDVPSARAPLTLFNWRYGHLLNFNGLTQIGAARVADRRRGVAVRARRAARLGRARMTAQRAGYNPGPRRIRRRLAPITGRAMSYYQRHVFFCCNKRDAPEKCCADAGAADDAGVREGARQGARPGRRGQGAHQQGRLPRPLRGRPGARRLSRGGLVHLRGPRRHRRDHRPPHREAARSSSGCAFDAAHHAARRRSTGPRARSRSSSTSPDGAAARHRAGRASASAAGRHPRQQGRADAREDVLRARATRRCASTSAASAHSERRVRRRRSARPTTRWRSLAHARATFGADAAGRARRVLVRRLRADARRAARGRRSGWCWSGPAVRRFAVEHVPRRHDRDPRRGGRRRAARRRARVGAAAGAAGRRVSRLRALLPRPAAAAAARDHRHVAASRRDAGRDVERTPSRRRRGDARRRPARRSGLRKRYGGQRSGARAVASTIRRGECFGLLGPNGAGKTTTLRCCLGLIDPDGGTIEMVGEPVPKARARGAHPRRRRAADGQPRSRLHRRARTCWSTAATSACRARCSRSAFRGCSSSRASRASATSASARSPAA